MGPRTAAQRVAQRARRAAQRIIHPLHAGACDFGDDAHARIDDLADRHSLAVYWDEPSPEQRSYRDGYADALQAVSDGDPEALAACGICTFSSHRNRGTHRHLDGHEYRTID